MCSENKIRSYDNWQAKLKSNKWIGDRAIWYMRSHFSDTGMILHMWTLSAGHLVATGNILFKDKLVPLFLFSIQLSYLRYYYCSKGKLMLYLYKVCCMFLLLSKRRI